MNQLDNQIYYEGEHLEAESGQGAGPSIGQMTAGILRYWRSILVVFILIVGLALPLVWFFAGEKHEAQTAIHVAPVVYSFLFPDKESDNVLPMYDSFKNTQAQFMLSENVLQRVADELADKNLPLFEKPADGFSERLKQVWRRRSLDVLMQDNSSMIYLLRQAIQKGQLVVASDRRSELITITMTSSDPREAKLIVDALVRAYQAIVLSKDEQGEDKKLADLNLERQRLTEQVDQFQSDIYSMAEQYGTSDLTARQEVMMDMVKDLQSQLTQTQAEREALESQLNLPLDPNGQLEMTQFVSPLSEQDLLNRRSKYINDDERLKRLTDSLITAEESLIRMKQNLTEGNPELQRQHDYIAALEGHAKERRQELTEEFGQIVEDETDFLENTSTGQRERQRERLKAALVQVEKHEELLNKRLGKANEEAIKLGRENLLIQKRQDQLSLTKELYDTIRQRIQQMEMERRRPARISVAYETSVTNVGSKRNKMLIAVIFAAFAAGVGQAFLRYKMDRSLRTPEDMVREVGLPIIGTTMSLPKGNQKALPEQFAFDYQTIRTNLKLINDGNIPQRLVITSPVSGEGKTTLSINLAISLARTGRKVLLIDGDLKNPDIADLLNIKDTRVGFAEVASGQVTFDQAVWHMPQTSLSVLPTEVNRHIDLVELLNRPATVELFERLDKEYDHIIIDTPPVMAAPEALLWARIAGSVVLSSLAGYTAAAILKEAIARLALARVRILGNVMSNVRYDNAYGAYGYGYGYGHGHADNAKRREQSQFLFPLENEEPTQAE